MKQVEQTETIFEIKKHQIRYMLCFHWEWIKTFFGVHSKNWKCFCLMNEDSLITKHRMQLLGANFLYSRTEKPIKHLNKNIPSLPRFDEKCLQWDITVGMKRQSFLVSTLGRRDQIGQVTSCTTLPELRGNQPTWS